MARRVVLLAASAAAFAPAALLPRTGSRVAATTGPKMQLSESIPFLEKPPKLDGSLAGDVGFDPMGFSNSYDMNWLREAELKNGRVAMLGVVGLIVPEFFTLPQFTPGVTPYEGVYTVPALGLVQILATCGWLEYKMHGGKMSADNMFEDGRAPGDFGWDPLGLGKKDLETLKLKEVKNGRLAMLAFGGILHQQLLSKTPTLAFEKTKGLTMLDFSKVQPFN
jgi:light-harvesting complex I chlorophyll a/b binding protein 4